MREKFSIRKRAHSFVYAFRGIFYTLRTQHNIWIQLALMLLALVLGFVYDITRMEWIAIAAVSGLVLSLEIVNTAIETFLDARYPEQDKKIGLVKDLAAGAVLMASIAALVVGLLIFIPKIFAL